MCLLVIPKKSLKLHKWENTWMLVAKVSPCFNTIGPRAHACQQSVSVYTSGEIAFSAQCKMFWLWWDACMHWMHLNAALVHVSLSLAMQYCMMTLCASQCKNWRAKNQLSDWANWHSEAVYTFIMHASLVQDSNHFCCSEIFSLAHSKWTPHSLHAWRLLSAAGELNSVRGSWMWVTSDVYPHEWTNSSLMENSKLKVQSWVVYVFQLVH